MRRCLHALIALLTLTALTFAGRGYLYCHMAEQAMPACCCGGSDDAQAEGDRPDEYADTPCCERRGSDVATSGAVAKLERADQHAEGPATIAVFTPAAAPSLAPLEQVTAFEPPRAPVLARGSPPRRGKLRARLGVTLC